ncbi:hypothetical protein QFZ37_003478 [Chryseobacterium ginsenosidimutans]|nr:hypothetical protein [Chryseobacterium ginsenosidimutans]
MIPHTTNDCTGTTTYKNIRRLDNQSASGVLYNSPHDKYQNLTDYRISNSVLELQFNSIYH